MAERPFGIVILTVLMVLDGIVGIAGSSLLILLGLAYPLFILLGLVRLIISGICLYVAYGLWNGIERARKLAICIVIIPLLIVLVMVLALSVVLPPWKIAEIWLPLMIELVIYIIFAAIVIFYLTRPHVKAFFGTSQISSSQQSFEIPEAFRVGLELLKHKSLELTEKLKEMTSGDILENLKKYREEKEKIEYYLKNLLNVYEKGEISEESYRELKEKYENELKTVEKKIAELILEIERRKEQHKKEIEKLKFEKNATLKLLEDIESKHRNGEIDEETYEKRKSEIEGKLRYLERRISEIEELLKRFESIRGE